MQMPESEGGVSSHRALPDTTATRNENGSWLGHGRATVVLAVPLIGTQLAQMALNVTDTVMVGWLGATELAAAVLGTQIFFVVYIFGSGFAVAVMPVAAAAEGRGDARSVRRSVRMSLWIVGLYSLIAMPLLWHTEALLLLLDQDPRVAALAGAYVRVVQWSMLPALVLAVLRSYLAVVDRAYVALAVIIVGGFSNALFNYALIFGHFGMPALGIVGSAVATLATQIIMAALVLVYGGTAPSLRRHDLFARFWRPDWPDFHDILRLGWPISATIIAEVGLFTASSIMMGWIGTVALAAHGIALQISSIAFMLPLGLASAATVRVGLHHGRGDHIGLGRAGLVAMIIATVTALCLALVFWAVPEWLVGFYLDKSNANSALVLATAVSFLFVAACFQIVDSLQAVGNGMLRGLKDTRVPMIMALVSYWLIGMPAAYLLGFAAGFGGIGIWWGLALGLMVAAVLMNHRFLRRERLGLLGRG
jgi:MATE family multidrug resistance protein